MTALCSAGGFRSGAFRGQTVDLADLNHAFLTRKGDYIPIDFERMVIDGDLSQDISLDSGDYIYVPSGLNKEIFVLGEVNTPTAIAYLRTMSIVEALAEARCYSDRASSRIIVIRGSLVNPIQFRVDIRRILWGFEPNFMLQPGDIVYVPAMRFTSLKEVLRAGVRAFVHSVANYGGQQFFKEVTRDAANAHSQEVDTNIEDAGFIIP